MGDTKVFAVLKSFFVKLFDIGFLVLATFGLLQETLVFGRTFAYFGPCSSRTHAHNISFTVRFYWWVESLHECSLVLWVRSVSEENDCFS